MLFLIVGVFGGLYSGVFTVNEAASVAAVLSFVCALLRRRVTWSSFFSGLREAASATGMLYVILIGAFVFSYFVTIARIPEALVQAIDALPLPPLAIVFLILLAYLVLGAVFDEISAMLITLPFILPVILKLGYDAVWWGVLNVVVIELGMIIPPIGVIVFLLHGLAPQIPIRHDLSRRYAVHHRRSRSSRRFWRPFRRSAFGCRHTCRPDEAQNRPLRYPAIGDGEWT